ncbi:MAG: serine hydrolase [Bacteroidia bacterium]|nr:serine hydrolase [Bacteroidia bacterium]
MKILNSITLLLLSLAMSSCTAVWRSTIYNAPGVNDYRIFPSRTVHAPDQPYPLLEGFQQPLPDPATWAMGDKYHPGDTPEEFFRKTGTTAFLVLHGDTLVHEYYSPDQDQNSTFTTFSLAKVFVSTLVGIAIHEGAIQSVDQLAADFLPELKNDSLLARLKIRHLLQMTSGIRPHESPANLINGIGRLYYGPDLEKTLRHLQGQYPPGTRFRYVNTNTQILGRILVKATGKPLAQYLEEKIWIPAGMESDATWSLDHEGGEEKAFCCLNAHARDFARFGLLFLNQGICKGSCLVPENWICDATALDTLEGARDRYQYCWYTSAEQIDFYGEGLIGQFVYVSPTTNTVIVRLGKKLINYATPWYDVLRALARVEAKPIRRERSKADLRQYAGTYIFDPSNLGDSALVGKKVEITACQGYLKCNPEFRNAFRMEPGPGHTFFNLDEGRRMEFAPNDQGEIRRIVWSKRGNVWQVWKN